jgi:plasmid stabilization system protein ParE
MRVRLTEDAASDLRSIMAFLSDRSAVVTQRILYQIANILGQLAAFPRLGHRGIVRAHLSG